MQSPGETIRARLEEKGWTQEELALITGRSRQAISDLIAGRSGISIETAVALGAAFGNEPSEWIQLEAGYRLSQIKQPPSDVEKRAKLFTIAPVRDMQKRGWISETRNLNELEDELQQFLGEDNLDELALPMIAAMRGRPLAHLNPSERAWLCRAKHMAASVIVEPFSSKKIGECEKRVRQLAAYQKEARHLHKLLSEYGIRFVVVEPIPGVKIDGATFWIGEDPVIAMSLRYDRIDGFWFTFMHELAHIRNGDAQSADIDLIDGTKGIIAATENEAERLANMQAADTLVPRDEMNSFIRRVGPLYSRERVIQFAHKVKMHPGIIVGQLQHRQEIGYGALRDLLVKVRHIITATSFTDGWDQMPMPTLKGGKSHVATYR